MGIIAQSLTVSSIFMRGSAAEGGPAPSLDWSAPTEEKIVAWDGATSGQFGISVATDEDGDVMAIGSEYNLNTGALYVRRWDGSQWLTGKVSPAGLSSGARFGHSCALSADGNTLIGGAPYDGTGSATVYVWDGSAWTQQTKVSAGSSSAVFGMSVALSGDGNVAVIGASNDDTEAGGAAGSIYVMTRTGSTWSALTRYTATPGEGSAVFGNSVDLAPDASTLIVGAANEDDGILNSGAAYIFVNSGGSWTQQARLVPGDRGSSDLFGNVVAISADGNTAVSSSAFNDDVGSNSGSAYVFVRDGTTWTQAQKLVSDDLAAGDNFGYSVDLSADGSLLFVGARLKADIATQRGAAYVFERSEDTFSQLAKLAPAGLVEGDRFGETLAISDDATTAMVGAILDDDLGSNTGAVYVLKST